METDKQRCNIGFSPLTSTNNKYIEITVSCIKSTGAEVYGFYSIFSHPRLLWRTDAVILNWFERLGEKPLPRIRKLLAKIGIIAILGIFRIKIIYVLHNRVNHEERNRKMSLWFMKHLCRRADKIIILSRASREVLTPYMNEKKIEKKICYIPHPNYIDAYTPNEAKMKTLVSIPENTLILLFVGAVRPYKNIELLISAAAQSSNRNIHFIIAGRPRDAAYKNALEEKAEGLSNITLLLQFIEDDILTALIHHSHMLILPYDQQSSLNSGTAILAFSCAKTVICPEIATIQDFPGDLCYTYTYNTAAEHRERLMEQISLAERDFSMRKGVIEEKGKKLYDIVKDENSQEHITELYRKLFSELKT
ncbi:glycosyltransferase [Brucepastera parasyntrophica]|uniref:glycosyltransferase n=1 Tax=Brucepastera parasyntrophica TaxID=2880008 RepID=UPI00210EF6FF|nr:glycosyltransferase [Brucepastera parasyntrophica]ULQ60049.1 glycosyltransferase [Brucepastera parasyntrophica]